MHQTHDHGLRADPLCDGAQDQTEAAFTSAELRKRRSSSTRVRCWTINDKVRSPLQASGRTAPSLSWRRSASQSPAQAGRERRRTASQQPRHTATASAASTCGAGVSGTRSRRTSTARPPACAKAHTADDHPASTRTGTGNAIPLEGPLTGSSSTEPSPPDATNAVVSSLAPQLSQPSPSGCERDRPDRFQVPGSAYGSSPDGSGSQSDCPPYPARCDMWA